MSEKLTAEQALAPEMVEALRFYADPGTYQQRHRPGDETRWSVIDGDDGDRARSILDRLDGERQYTIDGEEYTLD